MSEDKRVKLYIRPAEAEDIKDLKDNLRQADIEEITATGSNPLTSLCEGFIFSKECYTVINNKKPIGMFGLGVNNSIWFLGTEETIKHPKEWIKIGRQYINHFLEIYPVLANTVSVNNTAHINWLKHLGAKFSAPYEKNSNLFQDFYIIKKEG